jgi:hypothetical protein
VKDFLFNRPINSANEKAGGQCPPYRTIISEKLLKKGDMNNAGKIFIISFAVICGFIGIWYSYELGIRPLIESATKPQPTMQPKGNIADSQKPAEWYRVGEWSGKGPKNTETFHIPSHEWMIQWSTSPLKSMFGIGGFQIFVHKSDGILVGVAANVTEKDNDRTIMRGAGDYYLSINSTQAYGMGVLAKR